MLVRTNCFTNIQHLIFASAQNQPIRKASLDLRPRQPGALGEAAQFARDEAAQYGERAVLAYEAVMEEEATDGRVEVVCDGVTVQVYDVDAPARGARHLAEQPDGLLVAEVVREQ